MQSKGKTTEARKKADTSDVLLFQKRLEDRIQLFEKEKEMEGGVMNKVFEEIQREREDQLLSQADSLAMQMATIHYQKAERRSKVLETSRAMLTLQSLLIQQLRERKNLEKQDMAQSIQSHCLGLEEAEQQLQKERTEFDMIQFGNVSSKIYPAVSLGEEDGEEDAFQLESECRMTSILQEALNKCEQVITLVTERIQVMTVNNQAKEDLKEQMELKRLYENCDQDLEFASQLVRQSQVSTDVLLEVLRLLLPTLPESELLSITDALCPKQHPVSASAEQEHSGCAVELNLVLPVKLREDVVQKNMLNMSSWAMETERLQEKRQRLMEKLLPRSRLLFPKDAAPLIAEEKGKQDSFNKPQQLISKSSVAVKPQQSDRLDAAKEAENDMTSASACSALGSAATGERLFVFRDLPESCDSVDAPKRKRKRNFLNFKKSSVAPTTLP